MLNKKQKSMLARILAGTACLVLLLVFEHTSVLDGIPQEWVRKAILIVTALTGYLVAGYDVLLKAGTNIAHGQVFDENFLMTVATFGAFGIGSFTEAVAVMVFYQTGELFQNYAVGRSRASIAELMSIEPEQAILEGEDGSLTEIFPDEAEPGQTIVVRPGDRVPLDGVVLEGTSYLDTSSLTGESVPRTVRPGDEVISGCINQNGTLRVRVSRRYEDSTVAKVLEMVENATSRKAPVENFITRFAKYYTPIVTVAALLLALVPPLFFRQPWGDWVYRACTFLVISCPCALVISVPLGFFGGIGAASRIGVLVKGSVYLETLSGTGTFVFDKTGTLTKGRFEVTDVDAVSGDAAALLETAAHLECYSTHPIAEALKAAYRDSVRLSDMGTERERKDGADAQFIDSNRVSDAEEIPGHGISAVLDGERYLAGNLKLMKRYAVTPPDKAGQAGTVVYIGKPDGTYLGAVTISDTVKENAHEALLGIRALGNRKIVMLTGDRKEGAEQVGALLPIDRVVPELLPQDKVTQVTALMEESAASQERRKMVAFTGDGINDAPVLVTADLGIAMGALGSAAAVEAADIVLMDDDLAKIPKTVKIADRTLRIVRENIVFCLAVKFLVLILGAFGIATMWLAVFADVGVCVLAVLNSMRALRAA